jgi:hypothetical protein
LSSTSRPLRRRPARYRNTREAVIRRDRRLADTHGESTKTATFAGPCDDLSGHYSNPPEALEAVLDALRERASWCPWTGDLAVLAAARQWGGAPGGRRRDGDSSASDGGGGSARCGRMLSRPSGLAGLGQQLPLNWCATVCAKVSACRAGSLHDPSRVPMWVIL